LTIIYNSTGLFIQNLTEILDERETTLQEFLGNDFVISGDNAIANLQLADADRESSLQEAFLYFVSQIDPNTAEGIWLDFICALNNIKRYKPTKTLIPIKVIGTPSVSKEVETLLIVDEDTNEYYTNKNAFTISEDGTVNTIFIATSFGKISASSAHSYVLKTASSGISNIEWDSTGTYSIGRYAETDVELRLRREYSLSVNATSTLSSIKSNVSQVEGISYLNVYENDTSSTVDSIPAKAFEVVVIGGNDEDIARAILEKKPAGIQAYGTTTVTILDENGNSFDIGFTRPTEIPIEYNIELMVSSLQSAEWLDSLKQQLLNEFENNNVVGKDIYTSKFYSVLNEIPEIINVEAFNVEKEIESNNWSSSLVIGKREVATLSVDNITVSQNT
jgi:uncharacterized phage protein gp47/JayE